MYVCVLCVCVSLSLSLSFVCFFVGEYLCDCLCTIVIVCLSVLVGGEVGGCSLWLVYPCGSSCSERNYHFGLLLTDEGGESGRTRESSEPQNMEVDPPEGEKKSDA